VLVQLLHDKSAIIIAVVGTDEKAEFVKNLGADHIINYKKENINERVLEFTNGEGVHASLDSAGGLNFELSMNAIRKNGSLISYGTAAGEIPNVSERKKKK
jgi:NADPH2:quinone reductase